MSEREYNEGESASNASEVERGPAGSTNSSGERMSAGSSRPADDPTPAGSSRSTDDPIPAAPLRIDVLTLFPEMFTGPFDHSMLARARDSGILDIRVRDIRDFTHDKHRTADDYAYGGGGGMVMKPEPLFEAVESILEIAPLVPGGPPPPHPVVLMTPQGRPLRHAIALELSRHERLIIIAGHYEGFDERVRNHLATHEISIGDFVVTGGELPAMIAVDAIARLRPGVIGHDEGTHTDSFAEGRAGRLEHPHYTRPPDFRGWRIPEILVSGHHAEVERWRRRTSLERTLLRRPDLIDLEGLKEEERSWIEEMGGDGDSVREN